MNIAMIGPFGLRPKGTVSVRAVPLARALVQRGHRVTVLIPPWNFPKDSGRVFDDQGVQVRNVVLPRRLPLLGHAEITRRLVVAARDVQPDAIHFFKPKAFAGLAAWAWWYGRSILGAQARLIVDTDDWEGRGGWNDLEPYSRPQRAFFAWQERWGLTHADAVTVASRALETLVWSLGMSRDRVHYLPNGIAPAARPATALASANLRARYGLNGQPVVLLYTRFFEFALERLIAIWQQVVASQPDARLLVVGEGLFGEEQRFRERIAAEGLTATVTEAGWVSPDDLPAHFAVADLAIYPMDDTLINRTKCPVKLAELLAAGVPVVAEAVGQVREYIEPGRTGLLVPVGRPEAFTVTVSALLDDAGMRQAISEAAQARMGQQFSWDRLATQAESAYGI